MHNYKTKYFIAGSTGLAGSAICRKLDILQENYFGASTKDVDFKDYSQTLNILKKYNPETVVIAAARVGGIKANNDYPVEFLNDNILIGTNIINASFELKIPNLIFLGSSCVYPKHADQPMKESALLTGQIEDTNRAYAIAKIACIELVNAYRREYGVNWFSVMPTNLYGENDNFDLDTSHVFAAILKKVHEAKVNNLDKVNLWGSGNPKREFINSEDLASAIIYLSNNSPGYDLINIGVGYDFTIKELSQKISDIVGYDGDFIWNTEMPEGPPRKLMDSSRLFNMGWSPSVTLEEGIKKVYAWYVDSKGKK
jgi:GDP-L-fucose synthase